MSIRIFVIDRGRLNADGLTALLRFMGHAVHAASCVETALDEALAFRPDLALVDFTMSDAGQVCRALALSGTRIIAVGSHQPDCLGREPTETEVADFIAIPCDRSALSKMLARAEEEILDRQDHEKLGSWGSPAHRALQRQYWTHLAETTVVRLYGGTRDGQELCGDRAAHLYRILGEDPLHRTFFACRNRHKRVLDGYAWVTERHRYFVEAVMKTPEHTLIIARSLGIVH